MGGGNELLLADGAGGAGSGSGRGPERSVSADFRRTKQHLIQGNWRRMVLWLSQGTGAEGWSKPASLRIGLWVRLAK